MLIQNIIKYYNNNINDTKMQLLKKCCKMQTKKCHHSPASFILGLLFFLCLTVSGFHILCLI